ncbi:MAG TPA: hypothetical protein DDY37_03080 [Legionella sp.]|nr:hypothetical protein [Legionella sp.]
MALRAPHWWRTIEIYRWRRALGLDRHHTVYQQLFALVDGFSLSRDARRTQDAMEYVYGEIDFFSFIALLSQAKLDNHTIFYDLGSGTGKAVLACAMVFDVKESHGIERFPGLHHAAISLRNALALRPDYTAAAKKIHFLNDDFFNANVSQATLIFINATGFFGQRWTDLSMKIEQSTQCTVVITTSKALRSKAFSIIKITTVQMSWGTVKAYIQQRIQIG